MRRVVSLFLPSLSKVTWLFSMLGFFLTLAAAFSLLAHAELRRSTPGYVWLALGLLLLAIGYAPLAGSSMPEAACLVTEAVIVVPSRKLSGGLSRVIRTRSVRVAGSACGAISRTEPAARTEGSTCRAMSKRGPEAVSFTSIES